MTKQSHTTSLNGIILKSDKRFKPGHIKRESDVLRGHPDTMQIKRMEPPNTADPHLSLSPPLVVSAELAEALRW